MFTARFTPRLAISAAIFAAALGGCESTPIDPIVKPAMPARSAAQPMPLATPQVGSNFQNEIISWRAQRLKELTKEDGWLSVAGLYWLKPGNNIAGSGPNSVVVFPRGKSPEVAGTFTLQNSRVSFTPRPDAGISADGRPLTQSLLLKNDAETDGKPTVLKMNSLSFHIIQRGELMGVRIKDSNSTARANFKGLSYFDANPTWRVEAKLEPHNPPKKISIVNIIGITNDQPSPGALVFNLNGNTYRLDAVGENGADELDIMFADETSGRESYGAGRYLDAVKSRDKPGVYVIDFNKAYSPPCTFTRFATCPLPPPQNRLKLAVTAGEKNYAGSGH